jgi:hypothetical protein
MTECCGKISMSIQDYDWPQDLQQRLALAEAGGSVAAAAATEAAFYDELLERICTSGRPFLLMEVSCRCSAMFVLLQPVVSSGPLGMTCLSSTEAKAFQHDRG